MSDSKNHTLFNSVIDSGYTLNDNGTYTKQPKHTYFTLYLGDFDTEDNSIDEIFNTLRTTEGSKEVTIFIHSYGGSIAEGQRFQNIINNDFKNKSTTYLDNMGYSMGAMLFTFGHYRVVYENSEIMFHNYSSGYSGKGHELKAQQIHKDKTLTSYVKKTLKPFFKKKELKKLINGKDYWFDSMEMLKRGIATHIESDGKLFNYEEYLEYRKEK